MIEPINELSYEQQNEKLNQMKHNTKQHIYQTWKITITIKLKQIKIIYFTLKNPV